MTFELESLAAAKDEMEQLHPLHWEETGTGLVLSERRFNWGAYLAMEQNGLLQCVIARENGVMAGYCLSVVMPHLHSGDMTAIADNYFLHPDYRKGRNGLELLKAAESFWKEAGATVAQVTTKLKPDHSRILEYLGWNLHEKSYLKRLS